MARKTKRPLWLKALLVLLIAAPVGVAVWLYQDLRHWRPEESAFPEQGVDLSRGTAGVNFEVLKGSGADFVYLSASAGDGERSAEFTRALVAARKAGLEVGAVHRFDPCVPADGQSANFVTMVPRDSDLLPPVILLETTADQCPSRVSDAAVQSELTTLVNQIEAHSGKPAILAPVEEFEAAYAPSRRFDRQLWLTRSWVEPDYASRPWLMWTANRWYKTEAAQEPLRWVVVRP